jgi:hypothetical protein
MVFMILASFHCVGPPLTRNVVRAHQRLEDFTRTRTVSMVASTSGSAITSTSHQARLDMEHEGHFDRPGVDPGGTQLTIDGDRCRPSSAVEATSHGGCAVICGIRADLLSNQVGTHDSVGREEQQQGGKIPTAGCSEERVDDPLALGARCLRRGRLRHAPHLAPLSARQLAHGGIRAPHDSADLVERITEDIVQDERRPLGRRVSRTTCIASPVFSASSASASGSAGAGSAGAPSSATDLVRRLRSWSRQHRVTTVVSQAGRSSMSSVRESRSQASCRTSWASASDPSIRVAIAISRGRSASKSATSIVVTPC